MTGVVAVMSGYGVHRAAAVVPPSGTGSYTTYTSGGNTYGLYTFTSGGTFTVGQSGSFDVVIIGGGGGGSTGQRLGGIFGTNIYDRVGIAGDFISQTQTLAKGTYSITVGQGGTGAVWYYDGSVYMSYRNTSPTSGTSSSFNGLTANGGGTNGYATGGSSSSSITGSSYYYAQTPYHATGTTDWTPLTPRGYYGDGGDGGKGAPPLPNQLAGATNGQNGQNGVVFIRYQIS
jgi:hypothetical protein